MPGNSPAIIGLSAVLHLAVLPAAAQWSTFGVADSVWVQDLRVGFDVEVGLGVFESDTGDSERYFSSVFMPTIRRGRWQSGLMLKLRHNAGKLRREDYDEVRDFLSIVRFVQYSRKEEQGPYARMGDLEEARIGYGQVVNQYANTVSLDHPRIGVEFDWWAHTYRFESFVSDLAGIGPYGLRGAWRPFLDRSDTWERGMEFGVSIAGDVSGQARLVNPLSPGTSFLVDPDVAPVDSLAIVPAAQRPYPFFVSVDAGMPVHETRTDRVIGYTTLTRMHGHGWGVSVGTEARRNLGGTRLGARFEQRVSFGEYLPSYFNALYEVDRLQEIGATLSDGTRIDASNGKRNLLSDRSGVEFSSLIALEYSIRGRFRVKTSYEHAWNQATSGWFRFAFRVRHPDVTYIGRFSYDVINVGALGDLAHGLSQSSLVRLMGAYRFWKHLLLGAQIRQSFEPRERNGRIVGQSKRTRIVPFFMVRL